jgi:trans-aconitate methyltransferase
VRTSYHADFALRYARSRALSSHAKDVWVRELARVADGRHISTVVDLGAGAGRFWPVLRAAWQPETIVAIDASMAMLAQSDEHNGVFRVAGDIDAIPLASASADLCFCSMSLHYSADPIRVLYQLHEILRPGGTICIRTGTPTTLNSFDFLRYFPTAKKAEFSALPDRTQVEFWLKSAGFRQIHSYTVAVQQSESRFARLGKVWARGFPSLQLVPRAEFAGGFVCYTARLAIDAIRGIPIVFEETLLAAGRRP